MLNKFLSCAMFVILMAAGGVFAEDRQKSAQNQAFGDLDEFMAKVMRTRRLDAENLRDYMFREKEAMELKGGAKIVPQVSVHREYVWFVRDGYAVRSPVRIDGVGVSAKERAEAEEKWINRQKSREKNKNKEESGIRELSPEAFFGFKFEPGRYLYAGEKEFEGRKAVVVEYYPFADGSNGNNKSNKNDSGMYDLFAKTFLVTMLIYPDEHQILQITFDNVGLEFLPFRRLVRANDIKCSMVMDNPKGDVWLPREISAYGSVSTANTEFSVNFSREFYDYTKSDVKVKLRFDGAEDAGSENE